MTIAELNACSRRQFVAMLGSIFEGSPWVAERAWLHRPFRDVAELHTAMTAAVGAATREEQLALLCAHPDLGTQAAMSDASVGEQAAAGLDRLAPEELVRLQRLTAAYRARFGFPFLLAVRGRSKFDVLRALETRMLGTSDDELAEALAQTGRIAAWRLNDLVQ